MKKTIDKLVGTRISVGKGYAEYLHTELEDVNENWNDNWYQVSGEYVIHRGSEHDVYIYITGTSARAAKLDMGI